MSHNAQVLKAKIEAVIYASEEPVTIAQLAGLLGQEAQAELDALESQQPSLEMEPVAEPESGDPAPDANEYALNEEVLEPEVVEPVAEPVAGPAEGGPVGEAAPEPAAPDARAQAAAARQKERRLRDYFRALLDQLIADYADPARGLEIREVAGGFRLATKPEFHDAVRGFVRSLKPPLKLSLQALETLAVVAYKQPVTAPEISEIRGVDSAGVLGSLLARKLVTTAGRKPVIGRPILYKTTKEFLLRFGLKDIAELPSIEEFEKMAGELVQQLGDEPEPDLLRDAEPDTEPDTERGPEEAGMAEQNEASGRSSVQGGNSAPIAETAAVPKPTHIHHDTAEDLMADDSTHPEGARTEPATEPAEP